MVPDWANKANDTGDLNLRTTANYNSLLMLIEDEGCIYTS